jgi:hypothetical protein
MFFSFFTDELLFFRLEFSYVFLCPDFDGQGVRLQTAKSTVLSITVYVRSVKGVD